MGKAGGVRSPVATGSNKHGEMKGALGKHIGRYLDQYTFICVFGSVVGYVMMPLIGTMETLIFSAIVIGFSINSVMRKNSAKDKDDRKKSYKEDRKSKKNRPNSVQVITDSETQHRQRKEDVKKDAKTQDDIESEKERKLEEKREKKARKKEERLKRKEDEKKEREREETAHREKQEQRAVKKQQEKEAKDKARGFLFPTYESIKAIVSNQKAIRRERKYSTSSSTSSGSISTYTPRSHTHTPNKDHPSHRVPVRASSDPLIYPGSSFTSSQGVTPRHSGSATSTNLSFPHLVTPASNKSTPWSTPNHSPPPSYGTLPQGTTHTPHTDMSPHRHGLNELDPRLPSHTHTASSYDHRYKVWSNDNGSSRQLQLQPSFGHTPPVETLTPGRNWPCSHNHSNGQSNRVMNNVNTLPLASVSSADGRCSHNRQGVGCHGNSEIPGLMDYQCYPTLFNGSSMDPFGSQYSLFSDHGLSLFNFPMYTPTTTPSGGDNYGGHSSDRPNQIPVRSSSVCSGVDVPGSFEEDKGFDEWPNI